MYSYTYCILLNHRFGQNKGGTELVEHIWTYTPIHRSGGWRSNGIRMCGNRDEFWIFITLIPYLFSLFFSSSNPYSPSWQILNIRHHLSIIVKFIDWQLQYEQLQFIKHNNNSNNRIYIIITIYSFILFVLDNCSTKLHIIYQYITDLTM